MILSFIVAIAENKAMGKNNSLPWHLPEDFKYFKKTTLGKPVLMGRKTFDSLGKPLSGRLNIVISTQKNLQIPEGVLLFHDIDSAIKRLEIENTEEAFIIGGAKIFEETMPLADRLYITRVHTVIPDADTFFPDMDHTHWKLVWNEDHPADERHKYAYTFQRYERIEL
jgi:dihydrofolate reductase